VEELFLRDFRFSDIASMHGLNNVPDHPDLAIAAGCRLCADLLEPLQERFGRIAIRTAFRSCAVNALGNEQQKAGRTGCYCAANEANFVGHIWDRRNAQGHKCAMASVILPSFWDHFQAEGDWQKLA
jgi:hypothetical protein